MLRISVSEVGILDFEMLNRKMKVKISGPHHTRSSQESSLLGGVLEIIPWLVCPGLSLTPFHAFEDGVYNSDSTALFCIK